MRLIDNLTIPYLDDFLSNPIKWDIFISCGSFEDRCKMTSKILKNNNVEIGTSIIFNYKDTDPTNKKEANIKNMKKNLENVCDKQNIYVFDAEHSSRPSEGIKKFLKFIVEKNIKLQAIDIAIDISVFTKPYLFLLFKVLKEKFNISEYYVCYTEPGRYRRADQNNGEIILTEGLDRVKAFPGFSGFSFNSNEALIVNLGGEGIRSMEVYNDVNPTITYAINGFPAFQPGFNKISLDSNMRFLRESGASDNLFYAPALDPFETKKKISEIIKKIEETKTDINFVIAPLGSKMQAFGALLCALENKKIKVVYPFPSVFKADYSENCSPSRIFKVNFNKTI